MLVDYKFASKHGDILLLVLNFEIIFSQLLEDCLEERLEKGGSLLSDSEKAEGEAKELEWDENKV